MNKSSWHFGLVEMSFNKYLWCTRLVWLVTGHIANLNRGLKFISRLNCWAHVKWFKIKPFELWKCCPCTNIAIHISLVNVPVVYLTSFFSAQNTDNIQHSLQEEQHKRRLSRLRARRHLSERLLFTASPSLSIKNRNSALCLAFGLWEQGWENAFYIHLHPSA